MPPKKGKEKKKKPMLIDGIDTIPMNRKKLQAFAVGVKEGTEKEIAERNYFMLERDKIQKFWHISINQLNETRSALRNEDRRIEEAAEEDNKNLNFYKQKAKNIQKEIRNNLTQLKTEALVSLKNAMDVDIEKEQNILRDRRDLDRTYREQEVAHEDQMKTLELEHSENIHKARQEFEDKAKETELKYEKKVAILTKELATKHNKEMAEIEGRKNSDISNLTQAHETKFNDMRVYYNDITLNNLTLISTFKDQMEVLRMQNQRTIKQVADAASENRNLIERMNKATAEVANYKILLQNYEEDKKLLAKTVKKLHDTKREHDGLRLTKEALVLRFEKLEAEYNELYKRFVKAILEVQQKTSMKNEMLKRRMQTLNDAAEYQDAVIGQLCIEEKTSPRGVNKRLEQILAEKNTTIKDLQYELDKVYKSYNDMLETYEEKLSNYGIPKENLGYIPITLTPNIQERLPGKAIGMVTKNK